MAFLFILGGLCVNAAETALTFTGWEFPGAEPAWGNSYSSHTATFDLATVTFTNASKQTGTVTDCPVMKAGTVTVEFKDIAVSHVKFNLKQWGTKTKTATLSTSIDGTNFVDANVSSSTFVLESDLPSGVKAVRMSFTDTKNQVGLSSIDLVYEGSVAPSEPVAYEPNFADVEIWEGNTVTLDLGSKHPDVTFVPNDETIATVSEEGVITGVGIGETTITAMWVATEEFLEGSVDFKVSVVAIPEGLFDILTIDNFSDATSSYGNVSYTSTVTGIKYEGNMMKSNSSNGECMQFRWNEEDATKRAGIFNTENPNGLVLASVAIEWYSSTSNNNVINVYSSDEALSIAGMLNGEPVAQLTKDSSCKATNEIDNPAVYFGLRSNKNAHYIKSITLFWVEPKAPAIEFPKFEGTEHSFTTESSEIRIADADHAFDIYYRHTPAPAQNNVVARAEGEIADSFENKAEFDETNGQHVIPVSESGTLSYYAVHTATGKQSETNSITVTKTATTAIDAIGADNAEGEAEFFDIRGVKVNIDNAAPGLYIRRQGTTATKVVVK